LVPDLLEAWWQPILWVLRDNVLLILNIVNNTPIHQENPKLMQRPHKLLSSIDFFLYIDQGILQDVQTFLILHIHLSYNFKDALSHRYTFLLHVEPCDEDYSEYKQDEVVQNCPSY
jgi:hypothetical protein